MASYDAVAVSPSKKQALLGDATPLSVVVVSGKGLVALSSDGLTSNCMCEATLFLRGGKTATTKTKVAKMTRNPLWHCPVALGTHAIGDIESLQLAVRHVAGFTTKEMGVAVIPTDFFLGEPNTEQWFDLAPTATMMRQSSFRQDWPYGQVCVSLAPRSRSQGNSSALAASSSVLAASSCDAPVARKHDPVAELVAVRNCHQSLPQPGETWYVIAAAWVEAWLTFVAKKTNDAPSEVSNQSLLDPATGQLRATVHLKTDARLIDPQSWALYRRWYGGGPVIAVQVPTDVRSVGRWLAKLDLPSVAVVQ
ncbi:hypothetical protein SPRG_01229 [Saprolegnia parasitica CBS 223.65]|uniref:Uncharacterized protein n=1 Tax=Saprolegnia parasitica (strain CBS 223.65) TaxID=695850 RepID=A0A067D5E7_SAPPC|nr:hypothetical protein SPRG_01229 [Saprolegnia parasitica CBS 223.65]KDO33951.1 hypothetical protein SPRG_01229 [Saprolegnia parasitica CBS 223.65]|eukprot:XP_012194844.1 hypothetical protein SPRG_01229 [Saprolegnia parasitica CBS 223.65]